MTPDELKARTKLFAHRCVKLASQLPDNALGRVIQYQLTKCSTSVAANYRAACIAQSKSSFSAKMSIVVEEADESAFWLEFILEEDLFSIDKLGLLIKEAKELTSIFIASRKTINTRNHK